MSDDPSKSKDPLFNNFKPLFERLRELQRRFRPGAPFKWKPTKATKRPLAMRKTDRRRKNKAARIARRQNRKGRK